MEKEGIKIETVGIELNIPCKAIKGCKGRIIVKCPGKIVRTYQGKLIKSSKLEIESTPKKRCPVCKKVNHPGSIEIALVE